MDNPKPVDLRLIEGPTYSTVLKLAMPTVIAMLSQSAVNEIDVVFFARLPGCDASTAQAALLPSLILVWLFGGSLSAISVGTQALTARRYAEQKPEEAGAVMANAAWFCLCAGFVLSCIGAFAIGPLLSLMKLGPEVHAVALAYSRWRVLGIIGMSMTVGVKAFFDGIGKTHVHLIAAVVMNVFNVTFCWLFIFGNMGAPKMGAPGAGFSAFVATWIGLFIVLAFTIPERKRFKPFRFSNLSKKLTFDLLKLSLPAAGATVVMMVGFGAFSRVAGRLDEMAAQGTSAATLALSSCGRAEAVNGAATTNIVAIMKLTFTACIAFGTATATLVSQSLGAKRPETAERFGWGSVRLGLVIFGVIGLCEGVLFTPQIVGFITHSEAVRAAAMTPMRMMGVVTPLIAVALILSEALFGAGNTVFVALAQLCLIFLVLVPLAFVLGIYAHIGLLGMWLSAVLYAIGACIVMSLKFRGGAWKKITL
jgi:Na+-driven multidrug efflux pump